MHNRLRAAGYAALLATAGCQAVTQGLRHPGGYAGYKMDEKFLDARAGKQAQLLRAAIIVSLASRVGMASVRDGRDGDAFVKYQQNAVDQLNFMAGEVYQHDLNPAPAGGAPTAAVLCPSLRDPAGAWLAAGSCDAFAANFEAYLPQLEYKIGRLVIAALPQRQAAKFIEASGSGDIMAAAFGALRLAAASLDGVHRGAAAYRSALEVEALAACPATKTIDTVDDAVDCLGLERTSLRHPKGPPALPRDIPPVAFDPLLGLARNACRSLPLDLADEGSSAKPAEKAKERAVACAGIKFEPKLRYGGLRASASERPDPAVAPGPVAQPGGN